MANNDDCSSAQHTLGAQAQAQLPSLSAGGLCPQVAIGNTPIFLTRRASGIQTLSSTVTAGTRYVIQVVGGISLQNTTAVTIFSGQMPGGTTYQHSMSVAIGGPPANDNSTRRAWSRHEGAARTRAPEARR